ncbi:hypothetical protein ACX80E_09990 [Arthrobacter sp. TMN-49]
MPVASTTRRRVELVLVPLVAAFCMSLIIGAIVLDRDVRPCSAPNWENHLTLTLSESAKAASVTACSGSDCVPMAPTFAQGATGSTRLLAHQEDGSWRLNVGSQPPTAISFRVFDRAGNVLAAQSTALNWTRVTGNERCGGRMAEIKMGLNVP